MSEKQSRKQSRETVYLNPSERVVIERYSEFTATSKSQIIHVAVKEFIQRLPNDVRNQIKISHGAKK